MIAALYVETDGCYFGIPGVDPWDEARDARKYAGPWPVVAHPPCQRWGRFWHGSTRKPHQYKLGDDGGCFDAALASVRQWGGVIEHPADSHAWRHFGLKRPERHAGWQRADDHDGWTCYVEQGHYGHMSRKPTWLYVCGIARRIGMTAMVGGKDKTKIRNATPVQFRDVLVGIARQAATKEAYAWTA